MQIGSDSGWHHLVFHTAEGNILFELRCGLNELETRQNIGAKIQFQFNNINGIENMVKARV